MTTRAAFHTWASARRAPSVADGLRDDVSGLAFEFADDDDFCDIEATFLIPSEAELMALGLPPEPPPHLVAAVLRHVRRAETPAYRRWLWRLGDVLRRAA